MPNTCKSYEIILVADGWVTREDLPLGKEYIISNPYMLYGEKRNLTGNVHPPPIFKWGKQIIKYHKFESW